MKGIPAGRLLIRRYVDSSVQQTTLLYRPPEDPRFRELLVNHNGEVWERFGWTEHGAFEKMVKEGAVSMVNITWREATDEDLCRFQMLWDDPREERTWFARVREREVRLDASELERLERIFSSSPQHQIA